MKTLFLVNPLAGKVKDPEQVTSLIQSAYQKAGQSCEVQSINFDELDLMMAEIRSSSFQRIFAVGGDGTINAVASRLIGSDKAMGVIPGGSGNGLGRHLGMSVQMEKAIEEAPRLIEQKVDTGLFGGHAFVNLAGIGLDAAVAQGFSQAKSRGLLPYIQESAKGLLKRKSVDLSIQVGEEWQHFQGVIGVTVANGTQWGFDAKIAGGASLTDGLLDVRVIHRFPLVATPPILMRLFTGTLQDSNYVTSFKTSALHIHAAPLDWIQVDGEPQPAPEELTAKVIPQSLKLLAPPGVTL